MHEKLTAEYLRTVRAYNPQTGVWTYLVAVGRWKPGDIAGHLSREGYNVLEVAGQRYRAARLAHFYMKGVWPLHEIDHEDLNKANDAWDNIREATHAQNQANTKPRSASGFKGVYKHRKQWMAMIRQRGKTFYLGSFATPELASQAYQIAARMLSGDFARDR